MRLGVLAPSEIPLPLGDSYGGIEKIAEDFAGALAQKHEVDIYCTRTDAEANETNPRLGSYPSELGPIKEGYDYTFDFTHQKPLAQNYVPKNYAATTFLTDRLSYVNDIFPTRAAKASFRGSIGPVIYPGIKDVYAYRRDKGGYLLFLGRIAPYKRPDIAVQVARLSGTSLKVAGHVGKFSQWPDPRYADQIKAQCEENGFEFTPNPTLVQKAELLSKALALVVPSDWSLIKSQESFGIVAVEALMSGTPVITSGDGGLKEIVAPDSGAICNTLAEYLLAVEQAKDGRFLPESCRAVGNYFRAERMAEDYLSFAATAMARK